MKNKAKEEAIEVIETDHPILKQTLKVEEKLLVILLIKAIKQSKETGRN